jgi:hypothetical protein
LRAANGLLKLEILADHKRCGVENLLLILRVHDQGFDEGDVIGLAFFLARRRQLLSASIINLCSLSSLLYSCRRRSAI